MLNRKLRMGMIGGGPGAFIGAVHRIAANMDGEIELVLGGKEEQKRVLHAKKGEVVLIE